MSETRKTALFSEHEKLGCTFLSFGGYEMPLNYEAGVMAEHLDTRQRSGLFDISHMGRFLIRGETALPFLRYALTNDASLLEPMKAQYTLLSDEEGDILDDAFLYRSGSDEYLLVVNAGNAEKDWRRLSKENKAFEAQMEDVTADVGMLALQGPESPEILESLFPGQAVSGLPKNGILSIVHDGSRILLSKTGYTGEKNGYELFIPSAILPAMWRALLSLGAKPCGLGARDTLRLEAGFPLYGHELGKDPDGREIPVFANPVARFGVNFSDEERGFLGKTALSAKKLSCRQRISPFELTERGMPRAGYKVAVGGREIGYVTSGNSVPVTHGEGPATTHALRYIGLALIDIILEQGEEIEVIIRGKPVAAVLGKPK